MMNDSSQPPGGTSARATAQRFCFALLSVFLIVICCQSVHTAADIPVSAYSTGNRAWARFTGVQKNTDVFFKLMKAALGGDHPAEKDQDDED